MRHVVPGIIYFALVFGAGFVLGVIRVGVVVPWLGERRAELFEMPIMFAVMFCAARYVIVRCAVPSDASARLRMGAIALALLLAAEFALVVLLQRRTPAEYLAHRDPVSGSVYAAMLVAFALLPWWLRTGARR